MEKYEEQQLFLNDQRCHLFNYGKSLLCLVCKQTLLLLTGANSIDEQMLNHLESSDHKECMKALFKMCIPDEACDTDDVKYLDVATKSIFDISVLLGEESSYICQKGQQIVCLMCKSSISDITSSFVQVKKDIIQHLESAIHSNKIKEVCWFYRLNSKKDFLLFHKSILHCSVCQETSKCKESELLQSAVGHLESYNHEVRCNLRPRITDLRTSVNEEFSRNVHVGDHGLEATDKNYELNDLCDVKPLDIATGNEKEEYLRNSRDGGHDLEVTDTKYELDPFHLTSNTERNWFVKCEEQSEIVNEYGDNIDVLEAILPNVSRDIENQCQVPNKRKRINFDSTVCNSFDLEGQSSGANSVKAAKRTKCSVKTNNGGIMDTLHQITTSKEIFIKRNLLFLEYRPGSKEFVCILCNVLISVLPKTPGKLVKVFKPLRSHFEGKIHKKNCVEQVKTLNITNNFQNCSYQTDIINHSKEPDTIDFSQTDAIVNSVLKSAVYVENSSENQKLSGFSTNESEIKDVICHHQCKGDSKFQGKCCKCIKTMLKAAQPEESSFYIAVKNKKCVCSICMSRFSSKGGILPLLDSYLNHTKSKKHRKLLSLVEARITRRQLKKKEKSALNLISEEKANESQKTTIVSTNKSEIKDVVCCHQCKEDKKFLNKCYKCIRKMLSGVHPEFPKVFISVREKICFCPLCGFDLCSNRDFNALTISYLDHTKSKKHQRRESEVKAAKKKKKKATKGKTM